MCVCVLGMQRSLQSKPLTRPKTAGVEKRDVGTLTVAPGKREGGRKSYSKQKENLKLSEKS